ncbi:MAG: lipoprotein insertase outer membrane protein LolB [Sodalis sp. (in: enterobacteria)]
MPKRNYAFLILLLCNLVLTVCSVRTSSGMDISQTSQEEWYVHQQFLSGFNHYQTRGAFAYISSQKKVYARFNWQQTSDDCYRLIMTNPLGRTEMDLNFQSGMAQFINNQGKRYVSNDPESMIQKLVGISIPFNDLRQWILGLPGKASNFTLDSRGHLHTLNYTYNEQNWIVTYQGYSDNAILALPLNIELRHGDNRIKLKMDSWSL